MSDQSFEQLLEESLKTIHNGKVVTGTIIDVKEDQAILNIGYKADGILSRDEYTNDTNVDLREVLYDGDELEVKILKVNDGDGQVILSHKRLLADRGNKRLEEAAATGEVLTAKVSRVVPGGLSVEVEGSRVFIPASLVSDTYERNLDKLAGQEIEFIITEFNPKKRRIIGNRRQLITERKAELKKELFDKIEVDMNVTGTVKNVTDFGAFIDLGGADGLLHISEMSWGRIESPKKVFKVGQEVTAFIKEINGEKIALSLKFPGDNPWTKAEINYAAGNIVTGKVARMTDFGAFIELEPGIDALLHVSQISRQRVEKPADVLSIGQVIEAKVVDFNSEDKKISLSMKVLEPVPKKESKEPSGRNTDKYDDDEAVSIDVEAYISTHPDDEEEAPAGSFAALLAEATDGTAEEAVEAVEEVGEAAEAVEETEEAAQEVAEEAVQEAAEAVEEAEEAVQEAVEAVEEAAGEAVQEDE